MELAPSAPLLLGRSSERRALQQALSRSHSSKHLQLVQLKGPPGAGRTALLDDLERHARSEGCAVLRSAEQDPSGEAYEPGRMVARHLGLGGLRGGALDSAFLRAVRDWGWGEPLVLDGLRRLVQPHVRFPDPRDGVMRAGFVISFLELLAARHSGGVVLILQDLHRQQDCLSFALHLAQEELDLPVLLVTSFREGVLPWRSREARLLERLGRMSNCMTVRLGPIPGPEALALARRMGLSSTDAARAAQLSGGKLETLVELCRDRREREELLLESEPEEIQSKRLALSVDPGGEGHRSLEIAAVLGLSVDRQQWARACELLGVSVPEGLLASLYRRRLLIRKGSGFAFRRRALHRALLRSVRAQGRLARLSQVAASATVGVRDAGTLERRAGYLEHSGRPAEAASCLMMAAQTRLKAGDHVNAVRLLERRESLMARLSWADEVSRAQGLILEATALERRGRPEEAYEVAVQAERRARYSGDKELWIAALVCLATVLRGRGEMGRAMSCVRNARAALGRKRASVALQLEEAEIRAGLGDAAGALKLVDLLLPAASDLQAARALGVRARALLLREDLESAGEALDQAETRAWSAQSATEAVELQILRAHLLDLCGDRSGALRTMETAGRLVRRTGLQNAAIPDLFMGARLLESGQAAQAQGLLERAGVWLERRGRRDEEGLARLLEASAHIAQQRYARGEELVSVAEALLGGGEAASDRVLLALQAAHKQARQARQGVLGEAVGRAMERQERLLGQAGY